MQSAATAGFDGPIHAHIPPLDEDLGLTARAHQPLKLQELGELDGGSSVLCDLLVVLHGVLPT